MNRPYCNKTYKWIYKNKITSNDSSPPFIKYVYISNKGDFIYLETLENYEYNENNDFENLLTHLTKRRIDNDFAELTEYDLMYLPLETLTKKEIMNTIDSILNQKIKHMIIN